MKLVTANLNCLPKHPAMPMGAIWWRNVVSKTTPAVGS